MASSEIGSDMVVLLLAESGVVSGLFFMLALPGSVAWEESRALISQSVFHLRQMDGGESRKAIDQFRHRSLSCCSRRRFCGRILLQAVTDWPVRQSRFHLHEMDFAEPIAVLTATGAAQIGQKEI